MRVMTAASLYARLGPRTLGARGMWLNLGLWDEAGGIDEAAAALAMRVAEAGGMSASDEVVDVGFGFADQDLLWMERIGPRRITGLNVTPMQVRVARGRVARRGLSARIELREGSATAMPLPDASCDLVTAVECAFHFDTRADFLREAHRVLRPGGRIVLADVIRAAPDAKRAAWQRIGWRAFELLLAVPRANGDQREAYAARFAEAGFEALRIEPLGERVLSGWQRALGTDAALRARLPAPARLAARALARFSPRDVYAAFDYVIASARKPERPA
jgi:ubiquinone/menaquinone biosynthesis C-methylase UbiE